MASGRTLAIMIFLALNGVSAVQAEALVEVRAEPVDALGQVLTEVPVGADFELRVMVRDLRTSTELVSGSDGSYLFGVFAAFVTTTFDPALVTPTGPPEVNPFYGLIDESVVAEGQVFGGGASSSVNPPPKEMLLYSVPFHANQLGTVVFSPIPTLEAQGFEFLVYGSNSPLLGESDLVLISNPLSIVPEPGTGGLAVLGLAAVASVGWGQKRRRRTV